jgi:hypothetical protein
VLTLPNVKDDNHFFRLRDNCNLQFGQRMGEPRKIGVGDVGKRVMVAKKGEGVLRWCGKVAFGGRCARC